MSGSHKATEESRFVVLSKLDLLGPLNLLEIGFSATPQAVRNMAARGLLRVEVTITQRGLDYIRAEKIKRDRRRVKAVKAVNKQPVGCLEDRLLPRKNGSIS